MVNPPSGAPGDQGTAAVVVPVYFNRDSLSALLERLKAVSAGLPGLRFDFIFVDDGSRDGSFDLLREEAARDPRVKAIRLSRNFGSNAAILAGLAHCRNDCTVVMAADLQDPPELIPELINRWRGGADVVLAARRQRDDPWVSRILAGVFNRLFARFVFTDFPPNGFDFVLLSRRALDALVAMPEKNSYIFGQVMWLGFPRDVVEYDRTKRSQGSSRWTVAKKVKYFIDAFTAFSYLPVRAASFLGFVLAGLGFAWAVVVIIARLAGQIPIQGFAAVMVVLLVSAGTQLVVTGLIGEYLWRTLEEARRRPAFIIESTVNLGHDGK